MIVLLTKMMSPVEACPANPPHVPMLIICPGSYRSITNCVAAAADVFVHPLNWLQVSGTAERSQVDQRVRHQLHAIVPLLDTFKSEQQPLELIFPRKGPLDTHPQGMDDGVEEALAPTLGALAVTGILFDVGDQAGIE